MKLKRDIRCKKCGGKVTFSREGLFKMSIICNGCVEEESKCTCHKVVYTNG